METAGSEISVFASFIILLIFIWYTNLKFLLPSNRFIVWPENCESPAAEFWIIQSFEFLIANYQKVIIYGKKKKKPNFIYINWK